MIPRWPLLVALAVAVFGSARPAPAQITLTPGEFTYQFADATTGAPLTSIPMTGPGDYITFRIYLLQTGGTPVLNQFGVQGAAVRIKYDGAKIRVPSATNANLQANPAFTFIQVGGVGTSTDTSNTAFVQTGLLNYNDRLPFPQDTGDSMRLLIGTFRLQQIVPLPLGMTTAIQAVDPFPTNANNLTGPNPPRLLDPASPAAGYSSNGGGWINLDPYLLPNVLTSSPPTLVAIAVPEPSAISFAGLAATGGLVVLRRRRRMTALSR